MKLDKQAIEHLVDDLIYMDSHWEMTERLRELNLIFKPGDTSHSVLTTNETLLCQMKQEQE